MKLVRHGPAGAEKPGLWHRGSLRDLSNHLEDVAGAALSDEALARLRAIDPDSLEPLDPAVRLGPCVGGTGKFICIGLNYADHAAESGMQLPAEPVVFLKANSAICGPGDPILIPRGAEKVDWEVELAAIIGKKAKYVAEEHALDHVAGYAVANDLSERSFQLQRQGQWTKGKSCDSFGPLGPWLVTRDEVPDPQNLKLWCRVNGETLQDGSTRTMVFGVAFLVSYLSQIMTLYPGDVISTGTPPGVGMGMTPQRFLADGDCVTAGVEGLGEQRQEVRADR
jgi:2-keto-4-pentenoate hydratase/2-oxohepta-3-ene-1,7-dioic acid hydratase in catechol pathway